MSFMSFMSFSVLPTEIKKIISNFIEPSITSVEEVKDCGRCIKQLSLVNKDLRDVCKDRLSELKKYYQLNNYYFNSRGIGFENANCFVCGEDSFNNICAIVNKSKREDIISKIFNKIRARVHGSRDYQMIVGACDTHLPNLRYLDLKTHANDKNISKEIESKCRNANAEEINNYFQSKKDETNT